MGSTNATMKYFIYLLIIILSSISCSSATNKPEKVDLISKLNFGDTIRITFTADFENDTVTYYSSKLGQKILVLNTDHTIGVATDFYYILKNEIGYPKIKHKESWIVLDSIQYYKQVLVNKTSEKLEIEYENELAYFK